MIPSWCDKGIEWTDIKVGSDVYMISVTKKTDAFEVLLTNLIEIWVETLTEENILDKCQKLNPLLTVDTFIYDEIVTNVLSNIPRYVTEASVEQIKLRAPVEGGMMKFNLDLSKGSPLCFWENITKPLCLSSMELVRRHNILVDLVEKKDEEIAEYKAEGGQLIRKNIETKCFNRDQFKAELPLATFSNWTHAFQNMITFYNTLSPQRADAKKEFKPTSSANCQSESTGQTERVATTLTKSNSISASKELASSNSTQAEIGTSKSDNIDQDEHGTTAKTTASKMKAMNMIYKPMKKPKRSINDFIR